MGLWARRERRYSMKGCHIIVPKLLEGEHAYILQHNDGRVIFAIPYEQAYTLVGTTDVSIQGDPGEAKIDDEEKHYLCEIINTYFTSQIGLKDIVWAYSGVRPLYGDDSMDASSISRDYYLDLQFSEHQNPILNIYGGKITTYRRLSEHALEILSDQLPECIPG